MWKIQKLVWAKRYFKIKIWSNFIANQIIIFKTTFKIYDQVFRKFVIDKTQCLGEWHNVYTKLGEIKLETKIFKFFVNTYIYIYRIIISNQII